MKLPENVSESVKKRNPHLYGGLGAASAAKSEQVAVSALDGGLQGAETGPRCVEIRVSFVVFRRRLLDNDNNIASLKATQDAVAASLEIDDADSRIVWEYHQVKTSGKPGVTILIQAKISS